MSKSNILGIKNRFLIFTGVIAVAAIIIIVLFIQSVTKLERNNHNKEIIDELMVEYQSMQKFEQLFMSHYSEDQPFFKSGNNKYLRSHETASKHFDEILSQVEIDNDNEQLDLKNRLDRLKAINTNYQDLLKETANRIYLRGSANTGTIGELNQNAKRTLELTASSSLNSLVVKLNNNLKDYLLDKDPKYSKEFTNIFKQVSFLIDGNQISNEIAITDDSTLINENTGGNKQLVEELNKYKTNFRNLLKYDQQIGINSAEGLRKNLKDEAAKFDPELSGLKTNFQTIKDNYEQRSIWVFVIISAILLLIIILYSLIFSTSLSNSLSKLNNYLLPISKGLLPDKLLTLRQDNELQKMVNSINELIEGLKKTTSFAEAIGRGTFGTKFEPLSKQDALGNSLLEMRKNLIKAQEDEKKRQEEDNLRKWANEGLAEFNEILRQSAGDIDELTLSIVRNIVKFLKANQAGLFLINDTKKEDIHLELIATYAYDHERKKQKKIYLGEGLVGMCAVEKSTVYLEDIPQGYLSISSGLGGSSPRSLLIVPLKLEDEIFGVMEIASFNKFRPHEIEFVERVTESISSTLSLAKINTRTAVLLEKSQRQAEEMAAQEEEMRQNFEELQATQEESARREAEMSSILQAINNSSLVVEFDLNGYIINANEAILKLLGLQANELLGKHQGDFEKMDEANIRTEEFWERLRKGEIITESHKITVDSEIRWLHEVYTPILNAEGEPYKILNLATDITESKKLEQELMEKAEEMAFQEEELRKNLLELEQTQNEMNIKQEELKKANEQIKANEKYLQESIESAKEHERRLKTRNAELVEREVEFAKKIQDLELSNKKLKLDNEDYEKNQNKLVASENMLKKFLKESKDENKRNAEQLIILGEIESILEEKIDKLTLEIKRLKEAV
ncbi:MAG: GAF domain-containing protein [Bacteroidales bacterium]|nr:GAF domain-containing protein [Bacteroidales bacterium]